MRSFAGQLRADGFEGLHAHLFGAVIAGTFAARLAGVRSVGTLHDSYSVTERPARIRLLQLAAKSGVQLVTVASQMEALFRNMGRFPADRLQTIANGIDIDRYRPISSQAQQRQEREKLGLPDELPVIGSVGRLVPLKRYDELIRAFMSANTDAHLVIIGDGPESAALNALVSNLGGQQRIHLMGQREDVSQLLPLFDIFTLWSETEGLSCAVAEAMACGLPVVLSDVGGNHELAAPTCGVCIPPDQPAVLSGELSRLCENLSLRTAMGSAARQRIEAKFSLASMTKAYARLLDRGASV